MIGAYLKAHDLVPAHVLVSGALRTRETYGLAGPVAGLPAATFHNELYLATSAGILAFIRKTPAHARSVMVIGHNPGLAELTLRLADPGASDAAALDKAVRKFPTASLAVLDVLTPWSEIREDDGVLTRFITPSDLGGVDED